MRMVHQWKLAGSRVTTYSVRESVNFTVDPVYSFAQRDIIFFEFTSLSMGKYRQDTIGFIKRNEIQI